MRITGLEHNVDEFCTCCQDYQGDRIILKGDVLTPILNKQIQDGLDLSGFYKNVKQVNQLKFVLPPGKSRIVSDIDGGGVKFLAVLVENADPSKNPYAGGNQPIFNNNIANSMIVGSSSGNWFPSQANYYPNQQPHYLGKKRVSHGPPQSQATPILYWKKVGKDTIHEFTTAILNGSWNIVSSPFVSDFVAATFNISLKSDNLYKFITWNTISTSFVNGVNPVKWMDAKYPWESYNPLETTNTELVADTNTLSLPIQIVQDKVGNYKGTVNAGITLGTSIVNIAIAFSGVYGSTMTVDSFTMTLDGELVGSLFIKPGTLTFDFTTTPMCLTANYANFVATSGLIKQYDKIVSLMILTSTDNQPIPDIELYNGSPLNYTSIKLMIGS